MIMCFNQKRADHQLSYYNIICSSYDSVMPQPPHTLKQIFRPAFQVLTNLQFNMCPLNNLSFSGYLPSAPVQIADSSNDIYILARRRKKNITTTMFHAYCLLCSENNFVTQCESITWLANTLLSGSYITDNIYKPPPLRICQWQI